MNISKIYAYSPIKQAKNIHFKDIEAKTVRDEAQNVCEDVYILLRRDFEMPDDLKQSLIQYQIELQNKHNIGDSYIFDYATGRR